MLGSLSSARHLGQGGLDSGGAEHHHQGNPTKEHDMAPHVPPTVDRRLLTLYLTHHLSAATGVVQRLDRMTEEYTDLAVHDEIAGLARQIRTERDRLDEMIAELGLEQRRHEQVLARAGELVGRLKLNGRFLSRSPLTPNVELELLSSGVIGKLSLWQTLQAHQDELGLDAAELEQRAQDARTQLDTVERCRAVVAPDAFRRA